MSGLPGEYVHPGGLLTGEDHSILLATSSALMLCLATFGVISNIVNIMTFISMGLNDAVTVSFLGLAASDLLVSFAVLVVGGSSALRSHELRDGAVYTYDPFMIGLIANNIGNTIYVVTTLSTLYIAVARCMCILRPLNFKNMFTPKRSFIVFLNFVLYALCTHIPVMAHFRVKASNNTSLNGTRYVMGFAPGRETIKDIVFTLNMIVLPFSGQVVTVACVFIMAWKLVKHSEFRKTATGRLEAGHGKRNVSTTNDIDDSEEETSGSLSGKELQVVKQVVLISVLFLFLNTPTVLTGLFGMLEPKFDASWANNQYVRLYYVVHKWRRTCEQCNSAVNIFIYYSYNMKFRKHCRICPSGV